MKAKGNELPTMVSFATKARVSASVRMKTVWIMQCCAGKNDRVAAGYETKSTTKHPWVGWTIDAATRAPQRESRRNLALLAGQIQHVVAHSVTDKPASAFQQRFARIRPAITKATQRSDPTRQTWVGSSI